MDRQALSASWRRDARLGASLLSWLVSGGALALAGCGNVTYRLPSHGPTFVMGAIGDSITTGTDAFQQYDPSKYASIVNATFAGSEDATKQFAANVHDNLSLSWSVGDDSVRGLDSHFLRLQAIKPAVAAYSKAKAGSISADMAGQAAALRSIAKNKLDYVTLFIGGNDVCGNPTPETPISASDFGDHVRAAIDALIGDPADPTNPGRKTKILILPMPRVTALLGAASVKIGGSDVTCQQLWDDVAARGQHLCDPILLSAATPAMRDALAQGIAAANRELREQVAPHYPDNVKYVQALEDEPFGPEDFSEIDCFHPSIKGQSHISRVAWEHGWFAQ